MLPFSQNASALTVFFFSLLFIPQLQRSGRLYRTFREKVLHKEVSPPTVAEYVLYLLPVLDFPPAVCLCVALLSMPCEGGASCGPAL